MKNEISGIFTLDEVAANLKVDERMVYRLAAAKTLSAFNVGRTRRFSLAAIDRWIK